MSRRLGIIILGEPYGQSYKGSTVVNYDSRVIPDLKIRGYYDSRLVTYECKLFIRLTTGLVVMGRDSFLKFVSLDPCTVSWMDIFDLL